MIIPLGRNSDTGVQGASGKLRDDIGKAIRLFDCEVAVDHCGGNKQVIQLLNESVRQSASVFLVKVHKHVKKVRNLKPSFLVTAAAHGGDDLLNCVGRAGDGGDQGSVVRRIEDIAVPDFECGRQVIEKQIIVRLCLR